MSVRKRLFIIGKAAMAFGSMATFLCLFPDLIFWAIMFGVLGLSTSTLYIFIDHKYDVRRKKYTEGVIGMLLSSIPILLIVLINFLNHFHNQ